MLTAMTEEDWTIVLQVFAASRSRRGDKGRNDRKFLEALHYFVVHNITWRALPEKFGRWNSVWKRFWRLSRSGTFEAFFDALAAMSETAHLVQMFDSTVVRAHVSAAGAKGSSMIRRLAALSAMAAQTVSTVRAAALRNRCLSLAKTCSIGFRSGEYFGRNSSLAPTDRISWRTILLLWLPRLSIMTMSPGRRVGSKTFST